MANQHVWTLESALAWRDARDERLKSKGMKPFSKMTSKEKSDALRAEKESIIASELSVLKTRAWYVGKHPIKSYPAPFSGFLLLPTNYQATSGTQRLKIREGDDINRLVYNYYDRKVDGKTYPGDNYVTNDGLSPRGHEYMGPNPQIACYRFTGNTIEIEWWESYIKDMWIGTKKWSVEAEFDEVVEGWFLIDRNAVD